jgi:hypothetical protein
MSREFHAGISMTRRFPLQDQAATLTAILAASPESSRTGM